MDQKYFHSLAQAVIDGEAEVAVRLVKEGLAKGMNPIEAIEKGLARGILKVGDDFGTGAVFLPELIMAADVMKKATAILDEKIKASGAQRKSLGKMVIGTVKGDIHDIGKSVVASVLQANGYDVNDIGIDVAIEKFIESVKQDKADVLGMSTLLTTTMPVMRKVVALLKEQGLRKEVKVIVGGCPVTQEFANEIGADAVGFDASDAVKKVGKLLGH